MSDLGKGFKKLTSRDIFGYGSIILLFVLLFYLIFGAEEAESAPFDNAYVSMGFSYELGNTFGEGGEVVGTGRIGTVLWTGWRLEYEHHSNALDQDDKNSYDAFGFVTEFKFGKGCR